MAKFKLVSRPKYWWPITAHVPSDTKPGKTEEQKFKLLFEPMNSEEAKAWDEKVAQETPNAGWENDVAFLTQVTKDWMDVDGEDDQPAPFTEEALRAALQFNWFRTAVVTAYYASLSGPLARLGN